MSKYQIFTDSSCDLSTEMRNELHVDYFHMGIYVRGDLYPADLDWEAYSPEQLYDWIADLNNKCKTTLVSVEEFINKMTPYLEEGIDIVYVGCSSALTGTMNVFNIAKEELLEKYPDRRIIGIDSLTASMNLGLLVTLGAKEQAKGATLDEFIEFIENNKFKVNQIAGVETLTYLKAAGRVKAGAAFFGNIIGIKPLFISDRHGNNLVVQKVRGSQKMLDAIFEAVKEKIHKDKCDVVYVCHGRALATAERLKDRLVKELGVKVVINWAGPIIGITCGPGLIGAMCYGEEVTRFDGDGK